MLIEFLKRRSNIKTETIIGDLLESDAKYICHQCNCVSKGAAGLAFYLFDKFPYANVYERRTEPSNLGTIEICGDGKEQRYVINMFSQYYPGHALRWPDSSKDGVQAREKLFQECLDKISEIQDLDSIGFPYKIGCNLGGGTWEHYRTMIEQFGNNVDAKVFIYQRPGDV